VGSEPGPAHRIHLTRENLRETLDTGPFFRLAETNRMGYVNRNTVGAVVGVQPFGGEGLSGTGPKAGGPNYLQRFMVERVLTVNETAWGGNLDLLRSSSR
jgi:delta 1-pyrroline-5-carboxylate dehydrogenase